MSWQAVIGLEIHAQLATRSKIFSGASTAFGAEPNRQASAVDLGLPGVLPVVNAGVVDMAIRLGIALEAEIGRRSVFARKNYFYPDLPKGYQISQMALPVVGRGSVHVHFGESGARSIGITRAHLEEDAGKSVHDLFPGQTGIDLNRAGTPLLEIVSEPELHSAAEAAAYARHMHALVRWIGICDGNMQEGSFRCDANVSVRRSSGDPLGTRSEIKNLNSFRFLQKAVNFEIERQIDLLEGGGHIVQETRLYDPERDETRSMRTKEEANDYRYFPDPDLPPLLIDDARIEAVREQLPELPEARRERYRQTFELGDKDVATLTADRLTADYFEALIAHPGVTPRIAANWVLGELFAKLNREEQSLENCPVSATRLAGLLARVVDGTVSNKAGRQVLDALWNSDDSADAIIEREGMTQISDASAIEALVDEVIANNSDQVAEYRGGRPKLMAYFVGQVMKASRGKANPGQVSALLKSRLDGD